jgi:hypothetical protein
MTTDAATDPIANFEDTHGMTAVREFACGSQSRKPRPEDSDATRRRLPGHAHGRVPSSTAITSWSVSKDR